MLEYKSKITKVKGNKIMCMINSLPKFSKSMGNKKRNLALTLKVCPDDKTFYRFRLLGFSSDGKNDRDDVHI